MDLNSYLLAFVPEVAIQQTSADKCLLSANLYRGFRLSLKPDWLLLK